MKALKKEPHRVQQRRSDLVSSAPLAGDTGEEGDNTGSGILPGSERDPVTH